MRFLEFLSRMKIAVEDCMMVKPGDQVLIVTDTKTSENIKDALMAAIQTVGAEANIITFLPRSFNNEEVPRSVGAAMKAADAVFVMPSISMGHTRTTLEFLKSRIRYITFPMVTEDMVLRAFPTSVEELRKLKKRTEKLADLMDTSKTASIRSPEGTDIVLRLGKYKTHVNGGFVTPGTGEQLPSGNTAVLPVEGSAEGTYIVDVSLAFPTYKLVREPIACTVKEGKLKEIKGGSSAREFKKFLESFNDPSVFHVAELGVGTNPKCKFTGNGLEDERVEGCVRIAIGRDVMLGGQVWAPTHSDGMMSHATLELDGKVVVRDGRLMI